MVILQIPRKFWEDFSRSFCFSSDSSEAIRPGGMLAILQDLILAI